MATMNIPRPIRKASARTSEAVTEAFDEATEMAGEYYEDARQWLSHNYGKALGGIALVTLAGLAGYFLGKTQNED